MEQGVGQVSLLTRARDNHEILSDEKIGKKDKDSIRKIQRYKKFFYSFFNKDEEDIYSKTTFLDGDAVSFLIVVSPHDKIEAREECFFMMGCFPYMGFFDEKSADRYGRKMEKKGFVVYKRPVYAYSSLGYFTDPILSSFFFFDDFQLAKLIFHELFHTIFFVKDEVMLNENLAVYFSTRLAYAYFPDRADREREKERKRDEINRLIIRLVKILNKQYESVKTVEESKAILEKFLKETFHPALKKKCLALGLSKCFERKKWNNASFAAMLTYGKKTEDIARLAKKLNLTLLDFFIHIEKLYRRYKKLDYKGPFLEYMFLK